ncbi:MAG: nickel-dependent hydrogenase large subunit [Pseudomonadota bacterium]|nr:nickel-dependent hydrogenase large subunit [Pseudomonadota bacterium]
MSDGNGRTLLGPLNRVEGDLEIQVAVAAGRVSEAWVNSPLFRGFELILQGKAPMDALVYTPRICGICSVAQSVAAAGALAEYLQVTPTDNGRIATNLTLACENLADHLTHFYLFFMPDFARPGYQSEPWFEAIRERFRAQTGAAVNQVLPARAAFMRLTGILAGKWPHSLSLQPGGSSRALSTSDIVRLRMQIGSFRQFLEQVLFDGPLEQVAALASREQLQAWAAAHPHGDFARFLSVAEALKLETLGRTRHQFLSYGAYGQSRGHWFCRGVVGWQGNQLQPRTLDLDAITEDMSSAWLRGESAHPSVGHTQPDIDMPGYSWCKAPRLAQQVTEVGALARQVVAGHPLLLDLVREQGANVMNRVVARLLEFALVVPAMEDWCQQLIPTAAFCAPQSQRPVQGRGVGLVEAARGSLGHWLSVKDGRIHNYQIIAPTTWNFSPRDRAGQAGPLESALARTPVSGELHECLPIQHIIRSYDPCMVCTVH